MGCKHDDRLHIDNRCYGVECVVERMPQDEMVSSLLLTRSLLEQGFPLDDIRKVRRAAEAEAGRLADRVYQLGREQGLRELHRREPQSSCHVKLLESRPRVDRPHAAAVLEAREARKPMPYCLPECSAGPAARPWFFYWPVAAFVGGCWMGLVWLLIVGWLS